MEELQRGSVTLSNLAHTFEARFDLTRGLKRPKGTFLIALVNCMIQANGLSAD